MSEQHPLPIVMLLNGRGDYLLNMPALRALSVKFNGQFKLVVAIDAYRLILSEIEVAQVIELPFTTSAYGKEFDAQALADQIGFTPLFISLNPWHSPSMDAFLDLLDTPRSIGFSDGFTESLQLDFSKHTIELAFDPVRWIFPDTRLTDYLAPPSFRAEDQDLAKSIANSISGSSPIIAVHGDSLPDKTWASENMHDVIQCISHDWPSAVVVDVGLRSCITNVSRIPNNYVHLDQIILPAGFAFMKYVDLFFGIDSCFLHAADFYRKPIVALFGPTDPVEFGAFMGGPAHHLKKEHVNDITPNDVSAGIQILMPKKFAKRTAAA
jgi:ADP-heptose:LPS heptosyltransferase